MLRILIAGFYGEHNLGDDAFQTAIPIIIGSKHSYTFMHVNDFANCSDINEKYDVLLVGAGDVVLPYFLDRIRDRFTAGPTILFGGGITYPSCVDLGHLDQFDRVFLRNTTDLRIAESRLGIKYAHYIPDVVFALDQVSKSNFPCLLIEPSLSSSSSSSSTSLSSPLCRQRHQVGFYLIQSIDELKPDSVERQQRVLNQIAECIRYVAKKYDVVLIRFNTGGKRNSDDTHICETMLQLCPELMLNGSLTFDKNDYSTPEKMLQVMGEKYLNVCMRFHSHVFSIIQRVPFVSLSLTRKVHMLMAETGLADECAVKLEENRQTLRPLNLPVKQFFERFEHVDAHREQLASRLGQIHQQRQQLLLSGIYEKIILKSEKRKELTLPQQRDLLAKSTVEALALEIATTWERQLGFALKQENFVEGKTTFDLVETQGKKRIERKVQCMCKKAIYGITKQTESNYLWGFMQNMLNNPFKLNEYLLWIWNDYNVQQYKAMKQQKLYFDYMRQIEGAKFHRSGWPFVVSNLRQLESPYGVLCDMYVDRTFHWAVNLLTDAAIIPYTQSWIGFIHHTPLQEYSEYNVVKMLSNPVFLASLQTCRGLFVLSTVLKEWLDKHLSEAYFCERAIPIRVLTHPTLTPGFAECFSLNAFLANRDRKIVHIGAWLRDTFALYDIGVIDNADRALRQQRRRRRGARYRSNHTSSNQWSQSVGFIRVGNVRKKLRRCVLRGRDMNLYLPPSSVCIDDCNTICDSPDSTLNSPVSSSATVDSSSTNASSMCRISSTSKICRIDCDKLDKLSSETRLTNKWIEGLREHVDGTVSAGVDIIERLSNEEYDRLLTENIVFLCLRDASACNTVIECAVRNTPLLINKIPAVVETLGEDYPFYYNSLAEALLKSRNFKLIEKTHRYLCAMDKKKFDIDTFISDLTHSDIYENL